MTNPVSPKEVALRPSRFRRRYRSLRALVAIGSLLLFLVILNDQLLRWAGRQNPSSRVNWIFLQPETQYEVAILGSSLAKEGIDPALFESQTGQSTVQLAWGGRGVAEQALYWELFLQHHSCETLLLELHPRGLETDALPHPLDEFRYVSHLPNPTIERHLNREFGRVQTLAWQWIPMFAMAKFSTQIGWHDVLGYRRGVAFHPNAPADNDHSIGERELIAQAAQPDKRAGATEVSEKAIRQFTDILRLCQERDVRVIAFAPPIFEDLGPGEDEAMQEYRELLGPDVPILHIQGEFLSDSANFQDFLHLNRQGSQAFTSQLAERWQNLTAP